ncbi:MAG: hypothetical protein QOD01_1235, partial [Actinomycetota bacterium]|nr:hypothetical protein [Actinomycetota bacterium]
IYEALLGGADAGADAGTDAEG